MDHLGALFAEYGLPLVLAVVFVEKIGPPIPSGALLIVAAALSIRGRVPVSSVAAVAWLGCMLGNMTLYAIGSRYGRDAMSALCRFSVSPELHASKTSTSFERWGPALLIAAEFVPGVRTLAPTLAGAEKVRPVSFVLFAAIGSALWTAFYLSIGIVFHRQVADVLRFLERTGKIAVAVALGVAAYLTVRWLRRRQVNGSG
jgi:membrane protein DedA with SNARE-associated domain